MALGYAAHKGKPFMQLKIPYAFRVVYIVIKVHFKMLN